MDERNDDCAVDEKEESAQTQSEQAADQRGQNCHNGSQSGRNTAGGGYCGRSVVAYPQDVVLAATSLALALTKGRSQYEVETLINLFSLTTDNLQAILAQMLINRKVQDILETPL